MIQATRVTVGTTATRLDVADSQAFNGASVAVTCPTSDIYVGGADVTTANGYPVPAGTPFSVDLALDDRLFAVAGAPVDVHVLAVSV